MDTTLLAESRPETGKGAARKIRAAGRIPGVLYRDGQPATALSVDPHRLDEIFRKTQNRNTILSIQLDGTTTEAIVKEATRHPVSRRIEHLDLYALKPGAVVEVMVPLRGVGRPAGAALGGRLETLRRAIKVRAPYQQIPESIDFDVSSMEIGDSAKISAVTAPEGITLLYKADFTAFRIVGKRAAKKEA